MSGRTQHSSACYTFPPTPGTDRAGNGVGAKGFGYGRGDSGAALTAPQLGGGGERGRKRERTRILRSFLWGAQRQEEKVVKGVLKNNNYNKDGDKDRGRNGQKDIKGFREVNSIDKDNHAGPTAAPNTTTTTTNNNKEVKEVTTREEELGSVVVGSEDVSTSGGSFVSTVVNDPFQALGKGDSVNPEGSYSSSATVVEGGLQTTTTTTTMGERETDGTEVERGEGQASLTELRSEIGNLEATIIAESTEISRLESLRGNLQGRVMELKRDVEECKVGWKRSWARCEREIGELVLRRRSETRD